MDGDPQVLGSLEQRLRLALDRLPVRLLGWNDRRADLLLGLSLCRPVEGRERGIPILEVRAAGRPLR